MVGSPMYPSGHVQTGSWFKTLQLAFFEHGSSKAHGFMHNLFLHDVWSGQSLLLSQPAIIGATVAGKTNKKIYMS